MKKLKQLLALLLALLLLTGCAVRPGGTEPLESGQTDSTGIKLPTIPSHPMPTEPEPVVSRQVLPETVDNPENLPVLKWLCLTDMFGGYKRTWSEAGFTDINQMLADRKLPFRVQFVIYSFDYPISDNGVFFDRPEVQADLQSADLIYGYMSAEDAKNLLTPITEYVTGSTSTSLKNAVPHEHYWRFTTLDGEIYGVPTRKAYPTGLGWYVDKTFMEEQGLTDADFQKPFWEMDALFSRISDQYSGPFLFGNSDSYSIFTSYTTGVPLTDYSPGVAQAVLRQHFSRCGSVFGIDASSGKVVNVLDTDISRNMQQAIMRYTKAGYVTQKNNWKVQFGAVYGHLTGYSAGDSSYRIIPITASVQNMNDVVEPSRMNGIAKESNYQKEGVTLLALLAEDEDFLKQFAFGKEGRDYVINEEGFYRIKVNDAGADYGLSHLAIMSGFCGIQSENGNARNPGADYDQDIVCDGKSYLETHREIWDNIEAKYIIAFNYTGFEAELAAIEKVCKTYFSSYSMMAPEKYDKMIADFNAAGADRILASLQKQYDQWKKDNPDKVN